MIPGFISNIEHSWDWPDAARWLNHMGSRARVILFDKRGTGLSDRLGQLPHLDQRMDDARARCLLSSRYRGVSGLIADMLRPPSLDPKGTWQGKSNAPKGKNYSDWNCVSEAQTG